jgi:hypothetical protein
MEKLEYHTAEMASARGRWCTCGIASVATLVAIGMLVSACFAIRAGMMEMGVAYLCTIGLTGIGTLFGLTGALFGRRHRLIAMIGFVLNAAVFILAVRPLVNHG